MELITTRFADEISCDWSFGLISTEVGSHHLQLRCHFHVGVHRLAAVTARVNDVRSVRGNVESAPASSVRRQVTSYTVSRALVSSPHRRRVHHTTEEGHSRQNL